MGILDNLENSWNDDFIFESNPISVTDAAGREVFWDDLGRPNNENLSVKNFSDSCCNGCTCQVVHSTEFVQDIIDFEQ